MVVITGYGTADNEEKASVLGVSGFVRKPLTPEMIESVTLKAMNDAEVNQKAAELPEEAKLISETGTEVEVEPISTAVVHGKAGRIAKNVGLFFAAPFVALAYVIALPFVGFYMFAKLGREAYAKKNLTK